MSELQQSYDFVVSVPEPGNVTVLFSDGITYAHCEMSEAYFRSVPGSVIMDMLRRKMKELYRTQVVSNEQQG